MLDAPGLDAEAAVSRFVGQLHRRGWQVGGDDLLVREGEAALAALPGANAAGIPLLVRLTPEQLPAWVAAAGPAALLAGGEAALWEWWGPHRLYRDLVLGVAADPARRVVIGLNWLLVEGTHGCGLAATPRPPGGCKALPASGRLAGRPLAELAGWVTSLDPLEAALGVAAINAHYNRFDLGGEDANGLDELTAVSGPAVSVGRFPGLTERRPDIRIVERNPAPGEFTEAEAAWLLPAAAVAILTASALANHSLPSLLGMASRARRVLVGPGTPLSARLFDYGLEVLAGTVVADPEGAARVVAESGAVKALKPFTRNVTLRRI
jgi:uncharacterized protein